MLIGSLKSNLCYIDEKTYRNICTVLDCAITLLENQSIKKLILRG